MALRIKTGDRVKILAGKYVGQSDEVVDVLPDLHRVVLRDVGSVSKAVRPTQQNPNGGIEQIQAPIDISNVALVCPFCDSPTKIGAKIREDGTKVRVCKKCNREID
ncbi:MAG: 50S ribosomal protein L24 [Coriobacteriales bacterium]|nr:50S ribosomal protein L24 [Coriobacteriales bacterium]